MPSQKREVAICEPFRRCYVPLSRNELQGPQIAAWRIEEMG